ncbi:MAG: alpha/beta hydrolase [Sphingomicrobium sp.]
MTKDSRPDIAYLDGRGGRRLAYRLRPGSAPTLVFLPGFASDMDGAKAVALDAYAARRGAAMLRFDYSGTGSSDGNFADGTLDRWRDDALAVIDALVEGPLILIGSSMGAWIALHIALALPGRVAALVGIAAAPDFTDWGFSEELKREVLEHGKIERPDRYGSEPYTTTRAFWQSGEAMRLLDAPIAVDCPVRLVHGDADADVPLAVEIRLMEQLRSADVQLNIVKGGGHRLSEPHQIEAIVRTVAALLEPS